MNKAEILNSLEYSFSDLFYPHQRDFYKAIVDRDYDNNGGLVDKNHKHKGCKGTADEYPVPDDWW